jgi:hypothetical protein
MGVEQGFPEPRWEREWREYEENHMHRPKQPEQQETWEKEPDVQEAMGQLSEPVRKYIETTVFLRANHMPPVEKRHIQQVNQERLAQITQDDAQREELCKFQQVVFTAASRTRRDK